jgi:hypothetical protein
MRSVGERNWQPADEHIWAVEEFRKVKIPQVQWLLPGLLPGSGWTLILAPGKTGKTLFSIQLCQALATGTPFLECQPERPYRVLYVQADAPPKNWQKQLEQYGASGWYTAVPPRGFFTARRSQEKFRESVALIQPEFILWDALESILAIDTNDRLAIHRGIDAMSSVLAEPWALIHHPRKGKGDDAADTDPRNSASGSKFLTTNANAILELQAKIRAKTGRLTIMADREATQVWTLRRIEHGFWELDERNPEEDTPGEPARTPRKLRAREVAAADEALGER